MAILSMREPRMSDEDRAEIAEIVSHEKFRKANYRIVALCYVSIFFCMNLVFLLPTSIPIVLADLGVSSSIVGLFLGFHGVANAVFFERFHSVRIVNKRPERICGRGFNRKVHRPSHTKAEAGRFGHGNACDENASPLRRFRLQNPVSFQYSI